MRRAAAGLLLPVACGILATPSRAAGWEGRYEAGRPEYRQALTIDRTARGLRGRASVATRGCVGEFEGRGSPQGDTLVLSARGADATCRLTLRRSPTGFDLSEDLCLTFHGAACDFEGAYAPAAARRP